MKPLVCCGFLLFVFTVLAGAQGIEPIPRRLPPVGIEIPQAIQDTTLQRMSRLTSKLEPVKDSPHAADVNVLLKAVQMAVSQREMYKPSQFDLLRETLDLADERLQAIKAGAPDWTHKQLTVRGFYSRIDGSPQPYGLVIPQDLPSNQKVPLYVWLHGRGDKTTDIHFIKERLTKVGQISPTNAIVLHPFGRHCIGFKSAGETDVLEAIQHVKAHYPVDENRIVLMGFSMGGAGAWHLGAHYTDRFVAVSPGAGFAETAMYQKYSAERVAGTPDYERQLWRAYDVPNYVRNLFNTNVVCYSGEKDKQIQAAQVMEAAFEKHGRRLDHVIGPGMGHKYHPDALDEIMSKMKRAALAGKTLPSKVHLQTQTLRYSRMHWIQVERLARHWNDSRIDAKLEGDTIVCSTKNVTQFRIQPLPQGTRRIIVDGTEFKLTNADKLVISRSAKAETDWRLGPLSDRQTLAKRPGLQGPIDDAFLDRFLVVTPSGDSTSNLRDRWTQFELQHLRDRWSGLFRGKLPEKSANDVTKDDIKNCNLILFGSADNNALVKRIYASLSQDINEQIHRRVTSHGTNCIPQLIYPNPLNPQKYIVLNSGPTFREGHDRTNSLQNPKLPDWAIIDLEIPPNDKLPGGVVAAGFFDENWQFQ